MLELRNKNILIISPQKWGGMLLSKHHYAIELSKRNNRVFFLNPPEKKNKLGLKKILINPVSEYKDLYTIDHSLSFPYKIYFHSKYLYNLLISKHIRSIVKTIDLPLDIIWSFDIGNLFPLKLFPFKIYKIFHPVDEPLTNNGIKAAEIADVIFSVTNEILDKYNHLNIPKYFINHGVSDDFFTNFPTSKNEDIIRVGYSGNLTRSDIDRETIKLIISKYKYIEFHFWGSYESSQSNISGCNDFDTISFVKFLQLQSNVILHGVVSKQNLARSFGIIDLFLICYDILKDQSKGTNYHKVMEYLATGKCIVSNNVSAYNNTNDLVYMPLDRSSNNHMLSLFDNIISNLNQFNSKPLQEKRIKYSFANRYSNQIDRINSHINESLALNSKSQKLI